MKLFIVLSLLIFTNACGLPSYPSPRFIPPTPAPTPEAAPTGPEVVPTPVSEAEELNSYIQAFEVRNLLAGGSGNPKNLQVVFVSDLPDNTLGTCNMQTSYVKINKFLWDNLNAAHKEELIFHELGHCVLKRYHDNSKDEDNYPSSIMNSFHLGPSVYLRSLMAYQKYMSELFKVEQIIFASVNFNASDYPIAGSYASAYQFKEKDLIEHGEITCLDN